MTLPSFTRRKGLTLQGFLLVAFVVAISLPAIYLAFQPSNDVEGRPSLQQAVPNASLDQSFTPSSVDEGEHIRVKV